MARTISQLDDRDNVEIQEDVQQVRGLKPRKGLGGVSSILDVQFKDPAFSKEFYHCWEIGDDENSPEIFNRIENLGYEFVRPEELSGSQAQYQKSVSAGGSIVRVPAGKNQAGWLYLLKQPMQYRNEDLAEQLKEGQAPIKAMKHKARSEGGKVDQQYQSF